MKTMTLDEFHDACKSQGVSRDDIAVICPMCGTVQSAKDLINAGAGSNFDEVERFLGFSCVGRFTGAGSPKKGSGKSCNWTLGGFFQMHNLEVVTPDGTFPRFELATPEQAQIHAESVK